MIYMSLSRLSSYISCPAPPAPNSNAAPATQMTRRSPIRSGAGQRWSQGDPPRRGSTSDPPRGPPSDPPSDPPRDPTRRPPRRRESPPEEEKPPPPPPKTRPTLPSTDDETPPSLPGDLYFQYQKADLAKATTFAFFYFSKEACSS